MKALKWFMFGMVAMGLFAVLCTLFGCATHHPKSMSWDQENLKRNDKGCPTAIYIAPGGNLEQCQHAITLKLIGVPEPVTYTKYDTVEAAAIAGLKEIADLHGGVYEWGGMIGKTSDGKFVHSSPNTNYEGDHVRIENDMDQDVVASYHTHPCLPFHDVEYFSPPDLMEVLFTRAPETFMGDFCSGNVHEFKYGDKPDAEHPRRADGAPQDQIYLTKGRIVGQFTTPHKVSE
jgi:hypothetical protein